MKTLFKLFFLMATFSFIAGCNKTDDFAADEDFLLKSAQSHEVTVPFKVNLVGEIVSFDTTAVDCTEKGYLGRVIVEASGNATHMGKVSITFNFCTAGPPNPDIDGSKMTYAGFMGELVAANGDILYLSYSGGSIIDGRRDDHPEHVYEYWVTSIEVLGGTGRFEGAKGNLTADDYCSTLDDLTYHRFFGNITLRKGKK